MSEKYQYNENIPFSKEYLLNERNEIDLACGDRAKIEDIARRRKEALEKQFKCTQLNDTAQTLPKENLRKDVAKEKFVSSQAWIWLGLWILLTCLSLSSIGLRDSRDGLELLQLAGVIVIFFLVLFSIIIISNTSKSFIGGVVNSLAFVH